METSACLAMKNIGKPCTGKPYARFDEGGLVLPVPYSTQLHDPNYMCLTPIENRYYVSVIFHFFSFIYKLMFYF